MKVTGDLKLIRQMRSLPKEARAAIGKAIRTSTEEGARVARTLAPVRSGETRDGITTEFSADGLLGVVVVIDSDAPRAKKDRAYSIEHGRQAGDRGTTVAAKFVRTTKQYLQKKHRARIKRAINKAAREAVGNG